MPAFVQVSSIEKLDRLKLNIEDLFRKGHYAEITQSIGMYSILIDPDHTLHSQASLYRSVLNMIKDQVCRSKGKIYGAWYALFPTLLLELVNKKLLVTDETSQQAIASHCAAFGAFKSVDDFFGWAMDDRRLTLEQIVKYIMKTAEMHQS